MKVAVFGGTGFVGSYIIKKLKNKGFTPRILIRKMSKHKIDIDCEIIEGSIDDTSAIENTIIGTSAIIYNIGIIREFPKRGITYEKLHFEGVKSCIHLAQKVGVTRFILMSANGVRKNGTGYQITKWKADELLKKSQLEWTVFRPSLIFGNPNGKERPEFCTQLRNDMLSLPFPSPLFFTGLLPIDAGNFSMSPIHVQNVADFFVQSIKRQDCIGKIYNLGGAQEYTWKEIIHCIALASNKRTWKMPVPVIIIKMLAKFLDRFSWFPVTYDQLSMLVEGNIVKEQYFENFNIEYKEFSLENLAYLNNNK
tara:strand:+ start:668 stop:1594 length:927 start_codon:yes stop_codon:yes gene_type:complete